MKSQIMLLSPEQMLNVQLAFWINDPTQLTLKNRGKSRDEKLANLEEWKKLVAVKQKIVDAFKPRPGETDVFVHVFTGERLSYPDCLIETVLTEAEIELLDEEDEALEIFSDGYFEAARLVAQNLA
ncbi:hypothetical protein IQ277_06610 [Nostocales cyanobacterium LEGE 12452]|nr:hypothetical protein [Nostocales cyanobacterium LEGE 12452]